MATIKYFQSKDTNDKNNISLRNVIFSVILSYFFVMFSILILSVLVVYGPMETYTSEKILTFVYCISCVLCGYLSSVSLKRNGWINGAISSAVYFAVVLCSTLIVTQSSLSWDVILKLILTVVLGMIGGIAGVNKKKRRKK